MINFTEAHKKRLDELCLKALYEDIYVVGKFAMYNVCQLLKVVSINQLNEMKNRLTEKIDKPRDSWVEADQTELDNLKFQRELVDLIIGYKRRESELKEIEIKKKALLRTIEVLEESQKTPEEKIKEAKAQLASLQ